MKEERFKERREMGRRRKGSRRRRMHEGREKGHKHITDLLNNSGLDGGDSAATSASLQGLVVR